jgi:cyclophilin family peptidyl-prolyl cis-trans isomerase
LAQAGDPTATGTGGESIWSLIGSQTGADDVPRYFAPEIVPRLKHTEKGTVSMAVAPSIEGQASGGCGSQFFVTLSEGIEYLDGKHAVFGHVVEGLDTLDKINEVFVDQDGRPFKDIRIRHVVVLGTCQTFLSDDSPDPSQRIHFLIHRGLLFRTRRPLVPRTIRHALRKTKILSKNCPRKKPKSSAANRQPQPLP